MRPREWRQQEIRTRKSRHKNREESVVSDQGLANGSDKSALKFWGSPKGILVGCRTIQELQLQNKTDHVFEIGSLPETLKRVLSNPPDLRET